jgi:hypothetical protein
VSLSRNGFTIVKELDNGTVIAKPPADAEKCSFYWSMQFPANVDCEAIFNESVSKQTLWRECKTRLAQPKTILYIEGIRVGVYILCWAVAATFLWIARGFGMTSGEKRR